MKLDVTAVGQGRAWAGLAPTGGETELGRDVGGTVKINAEGQGGRGRATPLQSEWGGGVRTSDGRHTDGGAAC